MPTFSDLLKNFYDKEPEQVALYVVFSGQPDRPLTYRQLLQGANAYARAFEEHGVQPGEVVVLILQHGYDLVFAFYGAVLHGAIPSIMPFLTEKLLPERYRADLAALVGITQPAAIVTYPDFEAEVQAALSREPNDGSTSVRAVIVSDQIGAPLEPDFATLGGMQRSPGGYRPAAALVRHHRPAEGRGALAPGRAQPARDLQPGPAPVARRRDRLLAAAVPRHGPDRRLPDAHPVGHPAGDHVALRLGARPLQADAGRLALPRHALLAAQFRLQFLRPENPRARPGRGGPVQLARDQQLLRADALREPPGLPRALPPLRAAPRGAGHLLRHGRERLCRHPGRGGRPGDGGRDRPGRHAGRAPGPPRRL